MCPTWLDGGFRYSLSLSNVVFKMRQQTGNIMHSCTSDCSIDCHSTIISEIHSVDDNAEETKIAHVSVGNIHEGFAVRSEMYCVDSPRNEAFSYVYCVHQHHRRHHNHRHRRCVWWHELV